MNRREILKSRKKNRGNHIESGVHVEQFELPKELEGRTIRIYIGINVKPKN